MKKIRNIVIGIVIVFIIIILITIISENIKQKEYEKEEKEAISKISIKVPKKFDKNTYSDSISYYLYDDNNNCSFNIHVDTDSYKYYKDGKDYLEDRTYITLKDKVSEIQEVILNNYKWHYLSIERKNNFVYKYVTIKENTIYELEYRISDYTNGEEPNSYCYKIKDEIISTIKIK